jgi:hypothetical protein
MTGRGSSLIRRIVGFSLIVIGLILFYVLIPFVASQGMFAGFISILVVVSCIALGSFLFLRAGFLDAVKSLLMVLTMSVPWGAIFFLPLPGEIQFLLAAFVALVVVLFYRYYIKRNSFPKASRRD